MAYGILVVGVTSNQKVTGFRPTFGALSKALNFRMLRLFCQVKPNTKG